MRIGNCLVDEKMLDCFATLGLEPTGNMCEIQRAYRDTARMVHPDRVRRLGVAWTSEECTAAFGALRSAYEYLRGQFLEIDLPDYDIPYANDCDSFASASVADSEEFNRKFEEAHRGAHRGDGGMAEYGPQGARTLEELIALRNLPIPAEDPRPTVPMAVVPWVSDMVATCGVSAMVLGGEFPTTELGLLGLCDLDSAYGHPIDTMKWETECTECRDYPTEPVGYTGTVEYSEVVAREIREREDTERRLDSARRERFLLEFGP